MARPEYKLLRDGVEISVHETRADAEHAQERDIAEQAEGRYVISDEDYRRAEAQEFELEKWRMLEAAEAAKAAEAQGEQEASEAHEAELNRLRKLAKKAKVV